MVHRDFVALLVEESELRKTTEWEAASGHFPTVLTTMVLCPFKECDEHTYTQHCNTWPGRGLSFSRSELAEERPPRQPLDPPYLLACLGVLFNTGKV